MIGKDAYIEDDEIAAFTASSEKSIQELLELSSLVSKNDEFVLLLKNDKKLITRLLAAYINAKMRATDENMRSDSLQKEMLLFSAGSMNINNAIKTVGVQSGKNFIVFGNSNLAISKFKEKANLKNIHKLRLKLDASKAYEVASAGLD